MKTAPLLFVIFGFGFFTGLRAFSPLTLIAWLAVWGWIPLAGSPLGFIGTTVGAIIISIFAFIELVADKLPITPPRIQAGPLLARIVAGAMCGGAIAIAGGWFWGLGAVCGAIGSLVGAFVGYHVRRTIVRRFRVRDLFVAFAEDLVMIAGILLLITFLLNPPI